MDVISRRDALKVGFATATALAADVNNAASSAEGSRPVAEAVRAFNDRAAADPIGKEQPPLTEDEVIAAIRWAALDREALPVSDETFRALDRITETWQLPPGFDLEALNGFEPNDRVTFAAWSVRLRMPGTRWPNGTYSLSVREWMIRSRPIGAEERSVIHEWEKKEREKGGIGSFGRIRWMREYRRERAKAAAIDQAKPK